MITIPIRVCGDHWLNPEEVKQILNDTDEKDSVVLDIGSEGASLSALGIVDMITSVLPAHRVWVCAWPNNVDSVPFHPVDAYFCSHFFWMSDRYCPDSKIASNHHHRFAFFMGRSTWPRLRMLSDLHDRVAKHCLFSRMLGSTLPVHHGIELDHQQIWFDSSEHAQRAIDLDVASIDGHSVADQYQPDHDTNASILQHYHRFDIEIVSEAYTRGPCYFPTEKTVRPLLAGRAMLVYGPRHFLRNLRDQGFHTWAEYWDESYDDLEGPQRWAAMLQQIEILAGHQDFARIYQDYQHDCQHNRQQVLTLSKRHRPR